MLGPRGAFLVDRKEVVPLRGRDARADLKTLLEWVSIARNYLALTQPERVRLIALRALEGPEFELATAELRELAAKLDWLEVRSPDFHLYSASEESASRTAVFRARLGLERAGEGNRGGKLVLAILHEERDGQPDPESLQVIHVRRHQDLDGYRLPAELALWRAADALPRGRMTTSPYAELWLKPGGDLNPGLTAEDFVPKR
jgi:hypothetical protein